MAYFLVFPAFVLWLVVATSAVLIARTVSKVGPIYPYVWRVSVWATVGFLMANIALTVALVLGFVALDGSSSGPSTIRDALQIGLGASTIIGPFVASAVGWSAGAVLGLTLAYRSLKHA